MKFGIISRRNDSLFPYQAWPTLCRDDEGVLYVGASSFRLGHLCGFGKNVLYVSRNNGESWSCPRIFNDNALDDRDVGLCYLGEKKLLATWFSHPHTFYEPPKMTAWIDTAKSSVKPLARDIIEAWNHLDENMLSHVGSFCRISEDGGECWSEPIKLPLTSPHGPTVLSDGRLLFLGKRLSNDDNPLNNGCIAAYESTDGGKSWDFLSHVSFHPACNNDNLHEPYAIELADGTILGIIRAQGESIADALGEINDDLKQYKFTMFKTFSHDGGKSWTPAEPMGFLGAPPHMLLHSSGAIILTYSRRKVGMQGVFTRLSYDGGRTFGKETLIGPEANVWDQGYPSSVELDDGSIMTAYYQCYENDDFCSLLYTKWSIEEIEYSSVDNTLSV